MYARHLHAVVMDGCFAHAAYRGVDAGAVTARSQNTDSHFSVSLSLQYSFLLTVLSVVCQARICCSGV